MHAKVHAISFTALLALAALFHAPVLAQEAMTVQEQEAIARDAAEFARDEHARARQNEPTLTEGVGEGGAGRVGLDGRTLDVGKITPAADQSKVDSLGELSESGSTLDGLRTATEAREAELATDRGAEGQAYRTFERSAGRAKEFDQRVRDDDLFWESTLPHIAEGREGLVQGEDQLECETITTVETQPSEAYTEEEMTCDRIPDFSTVAMCTREWTDVTTTELYDQDRRALLNIDEGTSGEICRRERHVTSHQDTLYQSRAGDLEITEETAGLSCTRYRWAEAVVVAANKTKDASLAVNDEMGGLSCRRERWVTSSATTTNGSRTATLGIDSQQGGLSCTRWRTAASSGGSSGFVEVLATAVGSESANCWSGVIVDAPADAQFTLTVLAPGKTGYIRSTQRIGGQWHIQVVIERSRENTMFCSAEETDIRISWSSQTGGTVFGVQEQGNCGDPGSPNCPTSWNCTLNAPATIDGISVTPGQVSGLPALFPGAANTCLRGELRRQCSGSVATSTDVSIADLIPSGTTSIQNFAWVVNNPQSGVSVSLLQAPTAANGWLARFNVSKSNYGAVVNPSVTLTWQIQGTTYNWSVIDTGGTVVTNWGSDDFWGAATASIFAVGQVGATATTTDCSDPGSVACPTTWSCTGSAPTTINSIPVSAAMVSGLPQLFPGSTPTCVAGELRRVCSGASTLGTSVPIGDQIPAGVTTISNLAFTVLNPQNGIAVQLVVPPTYANGWNAGFQVTRSNYSYQPQPVQVRITFTVQETNIVLSLRETGNCSDPGSPACPAQWSCAASAPTTINGQTITLAMVQNEPALYPGSPAACVEGLLSRVCNGSSALSTQIPIGDLLPEGTEEITNFAWNVTNPQNALAVSLVAAPSYANGWVATFSVTRDYSVPGTPAKPNILMTWNVLGPVEYDHTIITEGDCSGASDGPESPSCEVRWRCVTPLPNTVNDIPLSTDMLVNDGGEELYPGEGLGCQEAVRESVCEGEGSNLTVIDISQQLPPGTQVILGYGWEIVVPGQGVSVTQVEPPTLGNSWRATFQTTRSDWSVTPTQPDIRLFWQVETSTTAPEIVEEGDCEAEGDEMCTAEWRCVEEFDPGDVGGVVSGGEYTASFSTLSVPANFSWSISGAIPSGITTISNFQMEVIQRGSASSISGVTQTPSAANGWMVRIHDAGRCSGGGGGGGDPGDPGGPIVIQGRLASTDGAQSGVRGFLATALGALVQKANAQATSPCGPNIVRFTWDNLSGGGAPPDVPPLFPGAPPTCKRAERYLDCRNINDGEICHETEQGTVCETIEGGPFDNCDELRNNDQCQYNRTICNEDGWGGTPENPVCRIEVDVYKCRTAVEGEDIIVHEETVCHGNLALCADGSCTDTVQQEQASDSASMRKTAAHLVMRENMMTDYVRLPPGGGGGGGGGDPGNPGGPIIINVAKNAIQDAGGLLLSGVVSEVRAQSFDPFDTESFMRGFQDAIPSDPDSFGAVFGEYTMDSLRFFDGKSYDCMKALGGLLNCCTKQIDPEKTNGEWWKSFGDILHKQWADNVQCKLNDLTDEQKESGSSFMIEGATFDDLAKGFTGLQDMLTGGGEEHSCGEQPRMEEVMNDFMHTMRQEVFPGLSWYCDSDEEELAAKKETGTCSYLGEYCRKRVLGFCIDRRQRHCCFNSPMTKMIREQLRDMGIKGMGTAKNPDCSGVSPADFAAMNTTDIDTGDLEGRMLLGGMFPDLASMLNGSEDLLEMFTGLGSSINDGRVNSLDRTNSQLEGTDPEAAVNSIDEILYGQVPEHPTPVEGTVPGTISFVTGYRSVTHAPGLNQREVKIGVKRDGNAGGVNVTINAVGETAVSGTDYTFATQSLSWGPEDSGVKDVILFVRKSGRTTPVTLELRFGTPGGGATVGGTAVMQIQIEPTEE